MSDNSITLSNFKYRKPTKYAIEAIDVIFWDKCTTDIIKRARRNKLIGFVGGGLIGTVEYLLDPFDLKKAKRINFRQIRAPCAWGTCNFPKYDWADKRIWYPIVGAALGWTTAQILSGKQYDNFKTIRLSGNRGMWQEARNEIPIFGVSIQLN